MLSYGDAYRGFSLADLERRRLSLQAYAREAEFLSELPKTPSGKAQRFLLRRGGDLRRSAPATGPGSPRPSARNPGGCG